MNNEEVSAGTATATPGLPQPLELAAKLQPLVEVIARPAIAFDSCGTVHAINEAAENLLGIQRGNLIGRGVELTNSLYTKRESRQERDTAVRGDGRVWEGEWVKVHASGQEVPARVRVVPLSGSDCLLEVVVAAEEGPSAAELERRLMTALAELAPVGLLILDVKNDILYSNPTFEKQFNRSRRVPAGVPLARYFDTADYLRLFGGISKAASRCPDREPATLRPQDGGGRPVRVSASDISDDLGRVTFRIAAIEDLAEVEGAREDAALLLEATRHLGEALFFTDPNGSVFFANKAAETLFGKSEEALIGAKIEELAGKSVTPRAGTPFEVVAFSVRLKLSGGKPVSKQVTAFGVPGKGGNTIARGWLFSPPRRKGRGQTPSGS
ncbi:MAG: PAS domain S-box protein [Candidatus Wallbacteria bacterium]|nr:PAS domain S-box protein [Candidatus Wallbacteria bacterium]